MSLISSALVLILIFMLSPNGIKSSKNLKKVRVYPSSPEHDDSERTISENNSPIRRRPFPEPRNPRNFRIENSPVSQDNDSESTISERNTYIRRRPSRDLGNPRNLRRGSSSASQDTDSERTSTNTSTESMHEDLDPYSSSTMHLGIRRNRESLFDRNQNISQDQQPQTFENNMGNYNSYHRSNRFAGDSEGYGESQEPD